MRTLLALSLALAALPAMAQTPPAPRVTFINMGEKLIEGEVVRPVGIFIDKNVRPEHRNLVELRHLVLHKLKDTAKDVSLR
jgi:hypothetical protein